MGTNILPQNLQLRVSLMINRAESLEPPSSGSVNEKVDPFPSSLATQILPPCASTIIFANDQSKACAFMPRGFTAGSLLIFC